MKKLFTLIAVALLSTAAMADPDVFGAVDKGWGDDGCNRQFTLGPGKTITFDFVVNNTSKAGDWAGWMTLITSADNAAEYVFMQCVGYGVTDKGWGDDTKSTNAGFNTWYKCNFVNVNYDTWKDELIGASVKVTISRVGAEIRYLADVRPTNGEIRGQYFVMDAGDGTQDIKILFGGDQAEIALNSSDITDSEADPEIQGTLVGQINNAGGFGLHSSDFTLAPESEATIRFYNYGNRAANWYNWIFEAQKGNKYLDLRCDNWGWGDYYDGANLSTENYDWSTFKYDMYGAAVEIVLSRTGNTLNFKATQTTTSGKVMKETYTVTNDDFASGDITYRMLTEGSHLDIVDELVTAISTVKAVKAEAGVRYNLAGQKVGNGFKGVVIENGKKLVVK